MCCEQLFCSLVHAKQETAFSCHATNLSTFSYKNASIFLQHIFNDLSGSVSLAWVGDGTGVSGFSMHLPCRAVKDVNSLAYIFLKCFLQTDPSFLW